jgi:hypothetical protein
MVWIRTSLPVLVMGAILSACAKAPPPPLLSFTQKTCVNTLDLAKATLLPLASADKPLVLNFDGDSQCLKVVGDESRSFSLLKLPEEASPYILAINSSPLGQGVFAPLVETLDENGRKLRVLAADDFIFRGANLSVSVRRRANEHFLLIKSDNGNIGKKSSRLTSQPGRNLVPTGITYVPVDLGYESNAEMVNAYNGKVEVAAFPVPKPN